MKKKPTLGSKVGSVHASLPTARQSGLFAGRRKSWEKDPNLQKNFSPTKKPQLTQPDRENCALLRCSPDIGEHWGLNFSRDFCKKARLGPQDA
jgi:hypothetical protein